jgi:1-acyl-sn-glycerol-3-phosphate acyltransferase
MRCRTLDRPTARSIAALFSSTRMLVLKSETNVLAYGTIVLGHADNRTQHRERVNRGGPVWTLAVARRCPSGFVERDGQPTALTLADWHTRRMTVTCSDPAAPGPARIGSRFRAVGQDWMDEQAPASPVRRYRAIRSFFWLATRTFSRVRVYGSDRLPAGPSILCFTHENWADPFFVVASVPSCPRLYFFGPEQDEMRRGLRNRLMRWGGVVIPFRPGKRGLMAATARAEALLAQGSVVAIAGEGRIHAGEGTVLPLKDGPAYLALRAGVPIVPMAINGTTWLGFRRVVRIRVGLPLEAQTLPGPSAEPVRRLTAELQSSLEMLVADFPEQNRPGPIGRWLTELFNDWPEGSRPGLEKSSEGGSRIEPPSTR